MARTLTLATTDLDAWIEVEKTIEGDIVWEPDNQRRTIWRFTAAVRDWERAWTIVGYWTHEGRPKLSFSIIDPAGKGKSTRVYALDIGRPHGNLTAVHKHRFDGRDYTPDDIFAGPTEISQAWQEFCAEANIVHEGQMVSIPPVESRLAV